MEEQPVVNTQNQQIPISPAPMNKKPNYWMIAGIIVVFLLLFGAIYALSLPSRKPTSPPPKPLASPPPNSPTLLDPTSNWQTYTNEQYGFEVKYYPESGPQERSGKETVGQFTYLLQVNFGTNPRKATYGYELRVNKQKYLNGYREELIGHITDKIDSEEQIVVNNIAWTEINYQQFIKIDYVLFTMAITNRAGYDYIITSATSAIERILSTFKFTNPEDQVVCTMDAKLCPDGSYVSRQPPNCEFTKCP